VRRLERFARGEEQRLEPREVLSALFVREGKGLEAVAGPGAAWAGA
jgi:hypothetical protein